MDREPTEAETARREAAKRASRGKAARRRRRAGADHAKAAAVVAEPQRTPEQRQAALIASLLRVAEAQTRALEARETPVPAAELKAAVDVLERLQRMQAAAAQSAGASQEDGRSLAELRDEFFNHLCRIRRERGLDPVVPPELA